MKVVYFLLISLFSLSINAQRGELSDLSQINENSDPIGIRVGIVPSALINPLPGIQIQLGYAFSDHIELISNGAFLFSTYNGDKVRGFRNRTGAKFIISDIEYTTRFFIEAGFLYRFDKVNTVGNFLLDEIILQDVAYSQKRKLTGPYVMPGMRINLGKNISLDLGLGLGIGQIKVENDGVPMGAINPNNDFIFTNYRNAGEDAFPIIFLHIAFSFLF